MTDPEAERDAFRDLVTERGFGVARANGGHLGHAKPHGEDAALCGFTPSRKAMRVQMKGRRGEWSRAGDGLWIRPCKKCAAALPSHPVNPPSGPRRAKAMMW